MTRHLLWAALLAASCAPTNGEVSLPMPDAMVYETELHPYLEATCATLDCHGDRGRPLRLYSDTGLRLRTDLRDTPMTPEEMAANAFALVAVDPTHAAEQHLVVLKPLNRSEGGMSHEGDNLHMTLADPGYRCLLGYLDGAYLDGARDTDFRRDCAEARDLYVVPPLAP